MQTEISATKTVTLMGAVLLLSLSSTWTYATDFRDATWGMTLRDVIALHPEEVPADRRIGAIAFDGKLAGLEVLIFYRFDEEGALYQAGYDILTDEDAGSSAITAYETLNNLLRQRYPESSTPDQAWRNPLFEDRPDEWGRAVRIGHMSYEWVHKVPRTTISHTLSGNRRNISHTLQYEAAVEEADQSVLEQL